MRKASIEKVRREAQMARVNEVENRIKELEGGKFQKLCNKYLYQKYGLENISPLGSQEGTDKTTIGVPDTFIEHADGKYTLIMYGTHKDAKRKIKEDVLDCLNESKTGIPKSKIKQIICCHTSTNISIHEIEGIKNKIKGVAIKLIGLGTLAQDISSPQFQGIAKEYLDIGFGTEQIFTINDFVKAYDKNATASPLDIDFKFREDKTAEIKEAVAKNTAVLVNGASGVGKTRISLEICKHFESEGYQVLCVKNNGQPLYDDFRIFASTPGKYLLFLDDMNQVSDIASVIGWVLQNNTENLDIKVLATVRDYAKGKVVELLENFHLFSEIKIPVFEDDEIKEIMDDCLGIKNTFFKNRIAKIAKGNVRLSILAGKFAIEDINMIKNSAEIFKHYYGNIIEEGKMNLETVKVLFVISLLNTVKINDDNFAKVLLDEFNISWEDFQRLSYDLHQKELVDLYLEEVVKISDQSFGNYILEYVLIERKLISIEKLLELGFNIKRGRIVYAINTVLELFHSDETEKYISDQVNNRWDKANPEEQDSYLETFYPMNLDKTLDILNRRISDMNAVTFEVTDAFFKEKLNYQNITSLEMKILNGFKNTKYFEEAIELAIIMFEKRPDLFMDIYFVFTKSFFYDRNSFELDYKKENELIDTLWRLRKKSDFNYDFLLLKVIEEFLKTFITITESGDNDRALIVTTFHIGLTEGSMELRRKLWEIISYLYNDEVHLAQIQSMLVTSHWTGEIKQVIPILNFDLSCIKDSFVKKWTNPNFEQCIILSKITNLAKNMGIEVNSEFKKYEDSESYQYYGIIEPKVNYKESDEQREGEIKKSTMDFSLDNYKQLFLIAKQLENNKVFLNYQHGANLAIAIENASKQIYISVINCYFQCGAPFSHNCVLIVFDMLKVLGFEQAYQIISEANFYYKNIWIRAIFETIPENMIDESQVNILIDFIERQKNEESPSVPRLNTILKYMKLDNTLLLKVCKTVCTIAEIHKSIAYDFLIEYHQSADKLVTIFSDNLDNLEDLYLYAQKEHLDYSGKIMIEIVKSNPKFWDRYILSIATEDFFNMQEKKEIFHEIWKMEGYHTFIDTAVSNLLYDPQKYIGRKGYELIFPVDAKSPFVTKRIKGWILKYICDNNSNTKIMHHLFLHYICNQNEVDRLEYIEEFLKCNKKVEDFETLSLLPTSSSFSGSEVPLIDRNISFVTNLLDNKYLKGLDFIGHRNSLKKLIFALEREKKIVQMREYRNDYIN